jgi:hypothetical protein
MASAGVALVRRAERQCRVFYEPVTSRSLICNLDMFT